jgi:hypothetical protein
MKRLSPATRCGLISIVLAACSGSSPPTAQLDAPPPHHDAAPGHADAAPDAPASSSSITGSVNGNSFTSVKTTYWIGSPDSATDTVVYLIDHVVACDQISQAGWDATLPTGTQILELKMVGKTPGTYAQTTAPSHIPAAGESASSYTAASPSATDVVASGGSVKLSALGASSATGTFHVTFTHGMLDGTFDADRCATGKEP